MRYAAESCFYLFVKQLLHEQLAHKPSVKHGRNGLKNSASGHQKPNSFHAVRSQKADVRTREYLTDDEVQRLAEAAKGNRHGLRATGVDLYNDVVTEATEWPTKEHSIKTLATHLGFRWRDTNPSGAASIEWYGRWIGHWLDPGTMRRR